MSLRVNLAGLLKDNVGAVRNFDYQGVWEADGLPQGHVAAAFKLTRTSRGVWVSGPARVTYDAECGRCLTPFTSWARLQVDEEYLPSVDAQSGRRISYSPEDDGAFLIDGRHETDFAEAIRQNRLAAMPIAPVCRDDCAGLCSACGANANEGACACEPEADPRWAALKELFA